MQKILSYLRRAIDDYNMINENEKIAVGVSGGKDSLTLLCSLKALSAFYPKKFELEAITVDMGFEDFDLSPVRELCEKIGVNYTVVKTNFAGLIFDIRKETNPCSLCAKLRRGTLHNAALGLGCRKVALAHHNDDVLETFFLSLFYEGRINCFSPVSYLDRKGIYLIRPFIYLPEKEIKAYAKHAQLPVVHNPCPTNGHTRRQYMKDLINSLNKEMPGLKKRLFTAIKNSEIKDWRI